MIVNASRIDAVHSNPFNPPTGEKSIVEIGENKYVAHETPEQILALIEGDESGLRERVEFFGLSARLTGMSYDRDLGKTYVTVECRGDHRSKIEGKPLVLRVGQ